MYAQLFALEADLLRAMAHPRRVEIIQLLRDQDLTVTDIYEMLDLPQANISQHLMVLRSAGIVVSRREGKTMVYALSHPKILEATDALRDVMIDQQQGSGIQEIAKLRMKDLVPIHHDPVCQMRVSPKTAGAATTYKGKQYYFCASGCHKVFTSAPEKYISLIEEGNKTHA